MFVEVRLKDGTFMKVRIVDGLIDEICYQKSNGNLTRSRNDSEDIKYWLKDILKADLEKFKEILSNIREDPKFFDYGKALLAAEREPKVGNLMKVRKEYVRRMEQLQAEIDRYNLPD